MFSVTVTLTFDLCSNFGHMHWAWCTGIAMRSFIRIRAVVTRTPHHLPPPVFELSTPPPLRPLHNSPTPRKSHSHSHFPTPPNSYSPPFPSRTVTAPPTPSKSNSPPWTRSPTPIFPLPRTKEAMKMTFWIIISKPSLDSLLISYPKYICYRNNWPNNTNIIPFSDLSNVEKIPLNWFNQIIL